MQSLESGVRSTVNSIHDELIGAGTRGTGPKPPAGAPTGHGKARRSVAIKNGSAFPPEPRQSEKERLRRPSAEWFWNLRQECDKVAEGR
jgi:hypothetical protein